MTQAQEHSGGDHGHGHGHGSRFIQHHYDDAQHQFDSGKLGIWFFLAQEILFFSALFVAYILYRHHHPEIFQYASHYLDVKWGAINTAVLIVSSLSAAWAVRCAQLNQKRGLVWCLVITIVCACGFLVIKYIEYSHKIHEHILFGSKFDPCVSSNGHHLVTKHNECPGTKSTIEWDFGGHTAKAGCLEPTIDTDPKLPGYQVDCMVEEVTLKRSGKEMVEAGRRSIPACPPEPIHGAGHGEVAKHAAPSGPCFEAQDNHLVCPKGPSILVLYHDDKERGDEVKIEATCNPYVAPAAPVDPLAVAPEAEPELGEVLVEQRPAKTKHEQIDEFASGPPPTNTNMFFSIYFAMTGLHGIHVLVGIFVFIWLLVRALKGHFTSDYFGPVDYAALYWHLVDLIWIFLFPMLYLIH
jgi:cytochrome c oxidase subunit III